MKISEKIIKLRKEKGLSQEQFGNEINVSRQAVSKWENEESKPDTDKIQEIAKKFNVSCDYLLNDKITSKEEVVKEPKEKKTKKVLKIIIVIFVVYLLISLYKFIAFYKFYSTANSFSENNYWIAQTNEYNKTSGEDNKTTFYTTRVNNKILETLYSNDDKKENNIPYSITYTDIDKKECFNLYYDKDKEKYIYNDRKDDMVNNEEIEELFRNENRVKENTLADIPAGLKNIFLASINPMYYYVDIVNREVRWYSITERIEKTVKLSKDCLSQEVFLKSEYGDLIKVTYSYDYVQDHFKEIENPLDTYKEKIIYENNLT